jgi:hypothetical protein
MGGRIGEDTSLVGIIVVEFWYATRSTSFGAGRGELDAAPLGEEELEIRIVSCGLRCFKGSLVQIGEVGI